jgi:PAS domain S-box-containing protein
VISGQLEDSGVISEGSRLRRRIAVVVGGYALVGALWILITDGLLLPGLTEAAASAGGLQTLKGLAFVGATAGALYLLMLWACREIRRAEAARGDSDRRLGLVFDSIRDHAIVLFSPDGRIEGCNDGAASVFGWQPAELVGRHISQFYLEEDIARGTVDQMLDVASETGRFERDFWHRRQDGSRFWANVTVSRLVDKAGRITGFVKVTRDMTERRRAEDILHASEERLKESERRTRLMMDSSVDGIIAIDEHGIVENFSGAAARIFGYAPEDVIGRNVNVLMPEPDRRQHDGYLKRYLTTGEKRIIGLGREVQGLKSDGTVFPMDLAVSEVSFSTDQRRFVGTVRDLTERRETERQLRQAQKMEAVGQLTGGLAHDFNNLLSVTLGCAEMLQERLVDDARGNKLCATILQAGHRGAELTNRLLAFSRRQTLEPADVDLCELVAGMRDLLVRSLGEDIEISSTLPDGLPRVVADPAQIENAVLNLAINARDAMPNGGQLMISVERARLDEDYMRHNPDVSVGDYVVLAASDTGIGMPKEVLDRAFDPFFTTKPLGKGTGLGLSMIYGFAKQSGGHAKIYSEVGIGTTVRLYLPQATGAALHAPAAPFHDARELPTGSETILVVEDDTLVRDYVTDQLLVMGYTVIAVGDGRAALSEIDSGRPLDVLFTDVVMPGGMNGRELAEEALIRRPELKVLFTTGYTEDVMVLQGKLAAGTQLLNKPYGRAQLARKLRSVIESRAV